MKLQDDFPDHDRRDWRALADKGLRGADFETLISRTENGLQRGPLFDAAQRPQTHAALTGPDSPLLAGRPWHVCAPVTDPDLHFANMQLLDDLKGGASAIRIGSLPITRRADLRRLLEGVLLDLVPIVFAPGSSAAIHAAGLDELYGTAVTLGLDPLGDKPDIPAGWRAFTIDAAATFEAGGSDGTELAVFAATLAETFRRHGSGAQPHMSALFALGTDAHMGIVKIRAARRLHAAVAGAFGIDDPALPIHAVTSQRMMQSEDGWTNMLRTTSAGFGAVIGGADYVTIRPFTDTPDHRRLGNATPFGYRIARNQQLLMMEESHLGQVRDAAYGSYFHERMTEDLAQSAWSTFQIIEAAGGIEPYRQRGDLESAVAADRQARADRAEPVLGVTLHASDNAPVPEVR